MAKSILIAYATAGIGHKKAALAVKKALDDAQSKDVSAILIDALDYTSASFKWSYLQLYLTAVNKLSTLWGFMYYLTDNFFVNLFVSKLRRFNNWLNSKQLRAFLINSKFDVIVATHFFVSEVAADLKKKGLIRSQLITVVTDFRLHSWWVSPYIDTYVVSNHDAENDLLKYKTDPSRIKVLGIPVEPVFSKSLDKGKLRRDFELEEGIFTVLVVGGGFGMGPIEEIVKAICSIDKPLQMVVVCGHNDELVGKMKALGASSKVRMKVLGFINNVDEYMEAADILISKPGGITVSESLTKELPMVVISPIPGQETRNSDFLIRHGAAIKIEKFDQLSSVVSALILDPAKINSLKEAIKKIRTPNASADIAGLALACARSDDV
ncbi:MAG: glycosyltransferase [Candidatus Omnitrophota bacterium]|jgi:processive 1,2-diacylglycerol beta-glucosyltransferase